MFTRISHEISLFSASASMRDIGRVSSGIRTKKLLFKFTIDNSIIRRDLIGTSEKT